MGTSEELLNYELSIENIYRVKVLVYKVTPSEKFPLGIKASYIMWHLELGTPRLLVDNHEPFGFHMHTKLPECKKHRELLETDDYNKALALFFNEVERITNEEKHLNN